MIALPYRSLPPSPALAAYGLSLGLDSLAHLGLGRRTTIGKQDPIQRTRSPQDQNDQQRRILKHAKDPLVRRRVAVQPLRTLCDTHNEADHEQADRDEDLIEQRSGERVLELGLGGDEARSSALDDEHERGKNGDGDELEDVAGEVDERGCLLVSVCAASEKGKGEGK